MTHSRYSIKNNQLKLDENPNYGEMFVYEIDIKPERTVLKFDDVAESDNHFSITYTENDDMTLIKRNTHIHKIRCNVENGVVIAVIMNTYEIQNSTYTDVATVIFNCDGLLSINETTIIATV